METQTQLPNQYLNKQKDLKKENKSGPKTPHRHKSGHRQSKTWESLAKTSRGQPPQNHSQRKLIPNCQRNISTLGRIWKTKIQSGQKKSHRDKLGNQQSKRGESIAIFGRDNHHKRTRIGIPDPYAKATSQQLEGVEKVKDKLYR